MVLYEETFTQFNRKGEGFDMKKVTSGLAIALLVFFTLLVAGVGNECLASSYATHHVQNFENSNSGGSAGQHREFDKGAYFDNTGIRQGGFGNTVIIQSTGPNVPIPPSVLLLGSGLLGLVSIRIQRSRS